MSKCKNKKLARANAHKQEERKKASAALTKENNEFLVVSQDYLAGLTAKTEKDAYTGAYMKVVDGHTDSIRECHEAGVAAVTKAREKSERDAAAKREKRRIEALSRNAQVSAVEDVATANPCGEVVLGAHEFSAGDSAPYPTMPAAQA